jgi:hypothetical protein
VDPQQLKKFEVAPVRAWRYPIGDQVEMRYLTASAKWIQRAARCVAAEAQ